MIPDFPRPAADAHLFIFGDHGLIFHESSQKFYVLNTAAVCLWCLLKEQGSLSQIYLNFAHNSNAPRARSEQIVRKTLAFWKRAGLLGNTRANSPTLLRTVVDLDPPADVPSAPAVVRPAIEEQRYKILDSTTKITFNSPDAAGLAYACFGHLHSNAWLTNELQLDVIAIDKGYLIRQGEVVKQFCHSIEQVVPALKGLMSAYALNNISPLMVLHAAVIGDGRTCILLPGASGSGKTLLTAAMMKAGYECLSDEFGVLHDATYTLQAMPLALCLKSSSWPLLSDRIPNLNALPIHKRFDGKVVRYLQPNRLLGEPGVDQERSARAIVFPRFEPKAKTAIRRLSPLEATVRLFDHALIIPRWLDQSIVESLLNWIQGLSCWELQMSSLDKAVACLEACFERDGRPGLQEPDQQ